MVKLKYDHYNLMSKKDKDRYAYGGTDETTWSQDLIGPVRIASVAYIIYVILMSLFYISGNLLEDSFVKVVSNGLLLITIIAIFVCISLTLDIIYIIFGFYTPKWIRDKYGQDFKNFDNEEKLKRLKKQIKDTERKIK